MEPSVSWREYVESRFTAQENALRLATTEMNRRLEGMNEFREENRRNMAMAVSREVFEVETRRLEDQIQTQKSRGDRLEGSLSTWRFLAVLLGAPGIAGVLLGLAALAR